MTILPIQQISEEDQALFGANLYHLAQLKRAGLPVADGIVVSPPDFLLQMVIKHFQNSSHEVFEQKLELVRAELFRITPPKELEKKDWQRMLKSWMETIKARIWAHGFTEGLTLNLQAQTVFLNSRGTQISAYLDTDSTEVVFNTEAKMGMRELEQIKNIVNEANKKLYLPQVYTFINSKQLELVGVTPYTHPVQLSGEVVVPTPKKTEKVLLRSTVKVFANLPLGYADLGAVDGVLIETERFDDPERLSFRLSETATQHQHIPLILKLPTHPSSFKHAVESYNFNQTKKGHLNISLCLPLCRSVNEFSGLKKGLKSRHLWLEIGTPENLLNFHQYLEVGLDGILLNLDTLHQQLFGYTSEEGEFYKHEVKTLVNFLEPNLKLVHKAKIPILCFGQQLFHPDVLHFLVENGVWGVVANTIIEAESLPEHLSWVEKKHKLSFR